MVNMNYTETRTDKLQCTEDKNIKVDTPSYYDGKNNYTAIDVVNNFDLNYNLGTACTYILRAYRKHNTPNEDLQKAINHLQFELNKINQ